jgi:V-type H+-transporting ATPase subunit F
MQSSVRDRQLIAVIGDEDSVTGILLAGVGHIDSKQKPNFLVVDNSKLVRTVT